MDLINYLSRLKAHQIAVFWVVILHSYPMGSITGITEAEICRWFSHDPNMTRHKIRHVLATLLKHKIIDKNPPNTYWPSLFTISVLGRFISNTRREKSAQLSPWPAMENTNEDEAFQEMTDKEKPKQDINNINNNRSPKRAKFTNEDLSHVTKMWNTLKVMNPRYRIPNLQKWANTVRLMREQDGFTHQDIDTAFRWALEHTFWQTVIQSPDSLRKHWNTIAAQMPTNSLHQSANPSGKGRELKVVL